MRPIHFILILAGFLAACGGSSEASGEGVVTSTTTTPPTSSTETSVVDPVSETSEAQAPITDPSAAVASWIELWEGAENLATDPDAARAAIQTVASDQVFEQLNTIYNPSVGDDVTVDSTARTFVNDPTTTVSAPGVVEINDCIFESPRIGNATIWYSGTAELVDDTWTITSLQLRSEIGCVPAVLAEDAIAGYEAYWDARVEFWDPADPQSDLLTQTTTGIHLDLLEGLLVDHEDQGLVLRGRAQTRPEVVEVRSATEIAILDCALQDPGRGLYDAETGERLLDIPAVAEGQTDLTSAVMIFEDGSWKVSDVQGQADVSCDAAPTAQGLPTV